MAAPSCSVPGLWVRGSWQRLGNLFTFVSKPLCSAAAASRPLDAQRLAERLRAQKQEQKTKKPVPTNPVQRRVQELLRFTEQLQRVHPNVLAKALSRGLVHQDKDLVVINKPYGLPVHAGVVDIPIIEKEAQGQERHHKMTLSPSYCMDNGKIVRVRTSRNAQLAVTQYRVLSSTLSSALVELQPITGIKHQLRVHLSFGLDCPVLGDHKYSDWNRLAPQKLSACILKKMGLPQSKARHIPLHLHACQLTLPALQPGKEELNLVCKPPRYFVHSLHRLGLRMPSRDQNGDEEATHSGAQ
ncbi:RNA pseudouridylate synthase domain-containing protein 4, partial [Eschrichtius robustus]|nr:RNA pseudouridylate synthase domain-containing protein 4 [Eschrichtius robustus]